VNEVLQSILRRIAPIVAAIAVFALLLQLLGFAGGDVMESIVRGSVGTPNALMQSLRWSIPLIIMGLAAVVTFRAGFFNVGGLGQYYLGTILSTWVATTWIDGPPWLVVTVALVAGGIGGALWSIVPGILRVYFGADEVVTTIMANFVAQYLVLYLVSGPMRDRSSATAQGAASAPVPEAFRISTSNGLSPVTIGITIAVMIAIWFIIQRTSFGVMSGMAGRNAVMLAWQGVKVGRIGVQSFAISGALAGLAGGMEILGPSGKLVTGLSPQVGNNAMLVALVAGLAVGGAVLAAVFFGALTAASLFLPIAVSLPASAIVVLNGIIAILVTASVKLPARRKRRRADPPAVPDPSPAPATAVTAPTPDGKA
jgi:general nucleoside transport system permease protein